MEHLKSFLYSVRIRSLNIHRLFLKKKEINEVILVNVKVYAILRVKINERGPLMGIALPICISAKSVCKSSRYITQVHYSWILAEA